MFGPVLGAFAYSSLEELLKTASLVGSFVADHWRLGTGATLIVECEPSVVEPDVNSGELVRLMLGRVRKTDALSALAQEAARPSFLPPPAPPAPSPGVAGRLRLPSIVPEPPDAHGPDDLPGVEFVEVPFSDWGRAKAQLWEQ